jgi:hypothetical protein
MEHNSREDDSRLTSQKIPRVLRNPILLSVALGGLVVSVPLGPRIAGSNPAEDDGF